MKNEKNTILELFYQNMELNKERHARVEHLLTISELSFKVAKQKQRQEEAKDQILTVASV